MNFGIESYLDYCEESFDSANEADLRYKTMRRMQTNHLALNNQLRMQKNLCQSKFNECNSIEELDQFSEWLTKQKNAIKRKINGSEIKDKATLQKFILLYKEYEEKINSKRQSFVNR
jgi:protein-arginine kinase